MVPQNLLRPETPPACPRYGALLPWTTQSIFLGPADSDPRGSGEQASAFVGDTNVEFSGLGAWRLHGLWKEHGTGVEWYRPRLEADFGSSPGVELVLKTC